LAFRPRQLTDVAIPSQRGNDDPEEESNWIRCSGGKYENSKEAVEKTKGHKDIEIS